MSVTGFDALRRRVGSIKTAMETGDLFKDAATEWAQEKVMPRIVAATPRGETGELVQSLKFVVGKNQVTFSATAPHAKFVHDGTVKMEARPFIRAPLAQTRRYLSEYTRKALRKYL